MKQYTMKAPTLFDADICHVKSGDVVNLLPSHTTIVVTHDPIDLSTLPSVEIAGLPQVLGGSGSNSDYEVMRNAATQTIIRRKTVDSTTVKVLGLTYAIVPPDIYTPPGGGGSHTPPASHGIGDMVIGTDFTIA
jgi:hypothetical protein